MRVLWESESKPLLSKVRTALLYSLHVFPEGNWVGQALPGFAKFVMIVPLRLNVFGNKSQEEVTSLSFLALRWGQVIDSSPGPFFLPFLKMDVMLTFQLPWVSC